MNTENRRVAIVGLEAGIAAAIAAKLATVKGAGPVAVGTYYEILNGELVGVHVNILPAEGILDCLGTWLGATAKKAGWYLGLYANAINPAAGWTAANVAATAGEITSQAEGYSETTRPQFVANAPAAGSIDNVNSEAAYTIVATGTVSVEGAFLISDSARGGTAGKLASATRFPSTRILQNGDSYKIGYRVTLTSA